MYGETNLLIYLYQLNDTSEVYWDEAVLEHTMLACTTCCLYRHYMTTSTTKQNTLTKQSISGITSMWRAKATAFKSVLCFPVLRANSCLLRLFRALHSGKIVSSDMNHKQTNCDIEFISVCLMLSTIFRVRLLLLRAPLPFLVYSQLLRCVSYSFLINPRWFMTWFYCHQLMQVACGSHRASFQGSSGLPLLGLLLVFRLRVSVSVDGFAGLERDPLEAWVRVTTLEGTSKRVSIGCVLCFKPLNGQSVLS
jgi:hypothetical protein